MYFLSVKGPGLTLTLTPKAINNFTVQLKHHLSAVFNYHIYPWLQFVWSGRVEILHWRRVVDFIGCYCIRQGSCFTLRVNYFPGCGGKKSLRSPWRHLKKNASASSSES